MKSLETPQLLLQRHYVDIEEWAQDIGWDSDFQQIEPGSASVSAYAFGTSRCLATRGEFSHSVRQVGSPPAGMLTIGLPDADIPAFRWCGSQAAGGNIVNFSLKNGFQGTSPTGFAGFALSFSEELLLDTLQRLALDNSILKRVRNQAVWNNAEQLTGRLRRQLAYVLRDNKARESAEAVELFNSAAASQILWFMAGKPDARGRVKNQPRQRTVQRALEYIEHSDHLNITIAELSGKTGVSTPTLYRSFEEEFGVGPKRFIQIQRLTRVRKELRTGDTSQSIADVANSWGFWHMGQFAADYRRHFGELPSETRRRIKRQNINSTLSIKIAKNR
jgi:AraC family ethanolamine operon transcriptional activator